MFIKNILDFLWAVGCGDLLIFLSQPLGKRLVNLAKFPLQSKLEEFLVSQALGLATISYAIFFLGLIGAIKRINFIIIFIFVLPLLFFSEIKESISGIKQALGNLFCYARHCSIGGLRRNILRRNNSSEAKTQFPLLLRRRIKLFLWFKNKTLLAKIALILLSLFLLLNFLNCFLPPIERDAMTYHLKMPKIYTQTGYVSPEPHNIYSYFPQLVEMLYTFGLIFSNDYSSHLIHFYFGILIALTIFSFVRRISNIETALFSVLTFYSLPVVSELSGWAYVDLALCFFSLLFLYFFTRALENMDRPATEALAGRQSLKLSAILLGLAFSVKYLAFLSLYAVIILFMIHLAKIKTSQRFWFIKQIIYFLVMLVIAALPWYLRNTLVTGNPFYPFFYSVFKGPYWDIERAKLYDIFLSVYGMGRSLTDYLLLPWRMTVYGGVDGPFDAQIGIVYILLTPLLIFFRSRHKSINYMLIYSAVFFFAWATLSQQGRFLLPVFAALSICFYAIINKRSMRLLVITLIIYNLFLSWQQFQKYKPFEFISGKTSHQQYLMKYLKDYPAINYINTHLSPNSKTYMVGIGNIGYYCQRPFMQESVFDYTFKKILMESSNQNQILDWLKNQGISHILINELSTAQYIYPDLGQIQLNIYKQFRQSHLKPIYTNGILFLYEIIT